jgi:hypothetical protein
MIAKIDAVAEVYRADEPFENEWIVSAIDPSGDGGIFNAAFSGPDAEQRALEYAALKYRELRRHDPDQPERRSSQNALDDVVRVSSRGANLRLVK